MNEILIFKTRVVIAREGYDELVGRATRYGRLAHELRRQLEDEHDMLMLALHQLARERGAKDRGYFVRQWLRDYRGEPAPRATVRKREANRNSRS